MPKRFLILAIAMFVGCFTVSCAANQKKATACSEIASSWLGAHIEEAILQLGPPAREHKTERGEIAMAWDKTPSRYIEGTSSTYTGSLVLTTDTAGIIKQIAGCR
jgi:hypothetical protein